MAMRACRWRGIAGFTRRVAVKLKPSGVIWLPFAARGLQQRVSSGVGDVVQLMQAKDLVMKPKGKVDRCTDGKCFAGGAQTGPTRCPPVSRLCSWPVSVPVLFSSFSRSKAPSQVSSTSLTKAPRMLTCFGEGVPGAPSYNPCLMMGNEASPANCRAPLVQCGSRTGNNCSPAHLIRLLFTPLNLDKIQLLLSPPFCTRHKMPFLFLPPRLREMEKHRLLVDVSIVCH